MVLDAFHPAVACWFRSQFAAPTAAQTAAWPAIAAGGHALIAAPTGSGKTLAAFLAAIDSLVRQSIAGTLTDATQVIYISPLKALSNDIQRNLEQPLAGIAAQTVALGLDGIPIRSRTRTGDTPQADRVAMRRCPPHILVTTPESLYLLLTSESGRQMLSSVRSVIVDEIHAVVGGKRGAHLALSLERLAALCTGPLQRIGLSATQKPIESVARFLAGSAVPAEAVTIVDSGHVRERDLALVLPDAPLEAVMSNEVWENLYDQMAQFSRSHRTTLIFANTRRMVERVTRHLSERIGEEQIAAHHGSLAREQRLDAEQRLKSGALRVLVATASLELGIDIGDVELVCQLGTPRSLSTFLQRVGRANHAVDGVPKGRLLPLSRDDLVECTALLDAVARGELDTLRIPPQPLDVLAQQIMAEVSAREYGEDELYELVRRAWPYRALPRADYDAVLQMLSDGISTRRGRQSAYLHRDAVNGRLRPRKGARLTAITCGGAIPDNADYQVILEPSATFVGTLNEDFAVESLSGDIFQLGNCSYRILRVEAGKVRVEDARGQPPTMPFWLGEAPARSDELSAAVSRLRTEVSASLPAMDDAGLRHAVAFVIERYRLEPHAARQLVDYLAAAKAVLTELPTQQRLIMERFFDESGDMHLVIHAPFGARVNRAYGLALRKRFCRTFNFELQAAATEDAIVLSLGESHSFALEEVPRFLHSESVTDVLTQALLDSPLFTTRWRWNASISMAIRRSRGGKRTPAPLQRMAAEDLLAMVFPDQLACAENLSGAREIPDHPLVRQTVYDSLHEAMDIDGLKRLLQAMESRQVEVITRDLPTPSPLAQEILSARPYAYLDDAPLEERRTNAVASRRWLDPQTASQFGQLDPAAIEAVRAQAWPVCDSADELHDALMLLGVLSEQRGQSEGWSVCFSQLQAQRRAGQLRCGERTVWTAVEQLPMLRSIYSDAQIDPALTVPAPYVNRCWERSDALRELLRGRLQATGPTTVAALALDLALADAEVEAALFALETEGFAMRGRFTATTAGMQTEWCERRLLARIHRYTIQALRAQIQPVSAADFMRFLLDWHGITARPRPEGPGSLERIVEQLEGFTLAAAAWEEDVLPARLAGYDGSWLDNLCLSGRVSWARITRSSSPGGGGAAGPVRATPIALLTRKQRVLRSLMALPTREDASLSSSASAMADYLQLHGASFFDEIAHGARLLPAQAEDALAELVAAGLVGSDSYSGLRALLMPMQRKRVLASRSRRPPLSGIEEAGRWSLLRRDTPMVDAADPADEEAAIEAIAWVMLHRYGVVFRKLLAREADWLPPWYIFLRAYRRLEAQGHIRGGRFVDGVSGEQYALPAAVETLRAVRKRAADGELIALSASDPLNLTGIITPGARLPALAGNRLLLRDGVPIATHAAGEVQFRAELSPAEQWQVRNALLRKLPRVPSLARVI
jgi:ATP-dependent Lhr-like helicase